MLLILIYDVLIKFRFDQSERSVLSAVKMCIRDRLYGVQSVRETQNIDLVITLEEWDRDKEYDRLGLEEQYTEFLGNKVVCHQLPIRPGRNLAIIVETAAINHRQKSMGYNAAQELYKRVQQNMTKRK